MLFWNLYSLVYSNLQKLIPYQEQRDLILDLAEAEKKRGLLLDVGCGTGNLMENRSNTIGLDISNGMIQFAHERNQNCRFVIADLGSLLPFKDATFDGAYSNNVLAYMSRPEGVIREMFRVLKPGAKLTVATLRPSFNPVAVLWNHKKRTSIFVLIRNFIPVSLILLLNLKIVIGLRSGKFHGFEEASLRKLFSACGFVVNLSRHSYADQDVLVVGTKPEAKC